MYKAYFKLARNPFDLPPDPAYFVSTRRHNEALAVLHYGIRRHKGFIVVTGEVGTGKTLLLRCLLRLLKDRKDVSYAYVFNSRMTASEFLQYILSDFGLPTAGKNKAELLVELGQFLIARGAKGLTTVLIVDEAHHLSEELLEEVRLLSNLETSEDKLLQIVLVGQPELDEKLDSVGLRQLKQRIALRAQLAPLDPGETRAYIDHRLRVAGAESEPESLFPEAAVAAIYAHSRGLPRLINTICENALITAYARQATAITPDVVADVARDFRLETSISSFPVSGRGDRGPEAQQSAGILRDLYSALRKPATRTAEAKLAEMMDSSDL